MKTDPTLTEIIFVCNVLLDRSLKVYTNKRNNISKLLIIPQGFRLYVLLCIHIAVSKLLSHLRCHDD